MRIQKRRFFISSLLIFSLLISPFGGLSLSANAEESNEQINEESKGSNEQTQKKYTKLSLELNDKDGEFYADNDVLSDTHILDYKDITIKVTYDDNGKEQEEKLDPSIAIGSDYTLETNLEDISKTAGKDQELWAKLTFDTTEGTTTKTTTIESNNDSSNPKVTILPSQEKKVTAVNLKLHDDVKDKNNVFYAANETLDADDTLDAEDLELILAYETRSYTDDYFDKNVTDESKKYKITPGTSKTITLKTGQKEYTVNDQSYEITTNVDDVRKTVKDDQELKAVLSYKDKDADGNDITVKVNSTENPKVKIIKASSTMKLKSIGLSLVDKNKKFYVDNGYMKENETLTLNDLELTLTYQNGKTDTKNLGKLKSNEFAVTTNVDSIRKLVGNKQEITAKLTYKDSTGKDVTISTIDSATAAKDTTKQTKATTVTTNILAPYAVNGIVTITPQNFGANPTDVFTDKTAIQGALDLAAANYTLLINFPSGTYYIGGPLYIHSNTTLKLADDAVIRRNSNSDDATARTGRDGINHNLLKVAPYNSKTTNTAGGYTNAENITIEGGTFDGGNISEAVDASNVLNLGHINNLTIKNTTIKNSYGNHLIEIVGVQNAEISGCKFSGFRYVTSQIKDDNGGVSYADAAGDLAEAIQIDVAHKDNKSAWTSAYLTDDTACANINIHDNTFTDYPVAVGNHHALAGHHHNNITITNNTITGTNTMNTGINLYGCDNSLVSGNVIVNNSAGIRVRASSGFTVTNNNINTAAYGIIETETSSGQIVSNTIDNINNQGISVYGSGTVASTISQNNISNSNSNGIHINSSATCSNLTNNTITTCKKNGISIYGSSNVPSVTKNTITECTNNGIYVYSSATATTIKSNKISNCSKYGVYITGKASVKTLSSNTLTNIKKNGIYVKDDKIKITFKSNKLTRVGSTAIKIDSKFASKKTQKYTFAPKVISLNLAGGVMTTQASHLKKIKIKVGSKSYTKSTKKKNYTFKFKKYTKSADSATVTFTDKNKNTVARVLDIE